MIRRAGPSDAKAFRAIRLDMLERHPENFSDRLEDVAALPIASFEALLTQAHVFFAEEGGALLGTAGWFENAHGAAEMSWVFVRPEARGRGLADRLIQAVIADAAKTNRDLFLQVASKNNAAVRAYERAGFRVETGRQELRSGCDALMVRSLDA